MCLCFQVVEYPFSPLSPRGATTLTDAGELSRGAQFTLSVVGPALGIAHGLNLPRSARGKVSTGRKTGRAIQQQDNYIVTRAQLFKTKPKTQKQLCTDVFVYNKPDCFKKNLRQLTQMLCT